MYKDDNMTGGCSNAIIRRMLEGHGNSYPVRKNGCSSNEDNGSSSGCDGMGWGLTGYPLASVYAPLQSFDDLYDTETALREGTVFKELDLPFTGERRVGKGGNCRG